MQCDSPESTSKRLCAQTLVQTIRQIYLIPMLYICSIAMLTACSPAPDNTHKIAEDSLNVLDKAKTIDVTIQQNTEDAKKKIDAASE